MFGRVLALSMMLNHPAFEKAQSGFASDGRVYLVYPDSRLTSLSRRPGGIRMSEAEAIGIAAWPSVDLPPPAIGKDYLGWRSVNKLPSGTGA